jgi:putative transposase
VERNALRSKLVKRAEDWKWSSLYRREKDNIKQQKLLSKWPIEMPKNYIKLVNEPQTNTELETLRYSVNKGKPYGSDHWIDKMIDRFKLGATLRNPGRPKKGS